MFLDIDDYFVESADDGILLLEKAGGSTIIYNDIYPIIVKKLSTPDGRNKFNRFVEDFVNRNNSKLMTSGPQYLIPFTFRDKTALYEIFNIDEKFLLDRIKAIISQINDKANWTLLKQNPVFIILFCIIKYYTLQNDVKNLNNALIITSLTFYPSIFTKYFKFEPNEKIMNFTIDNLTNRFIIKKTKHIFGTLTKSIQNSWEFHNKKGTFKSNMDMDCIAFIQRIRNDQNSLIKKIRNEFEKNYRKGIAIGTQVDSYEDNAVADIENDSSRVEIITNKVVLNIITEGLNLAYCDLAANISKVSKMDLRNYLNDIISNKNDKDMKSFVESILFLFLYEGKYQINEINSKKFMAFCIGLFKKTNSKNENISNVKMLLDKWGTDSGIYGKFSRLATRVDYTRAIFMYFVICIQQYGR